MSKQSEVRLCFHPAAKKRGLAVGTALSTGAMLGGLCFMLKEVYIVALLAILLIYALLPFYVPTYYLLNREGISMKRYGREQHHKWADYRAYSVQGNGIVIWADIEGASSKAKLAAQMKAISNSVFFPMDKDMIAQAEPFLKTVLVHT